MREMRKRLETGTAYHADVNRLCRWTSAELDHNRQLNNFVMLAAEVEARVLHELTRVCVCQVCHLPEPYVNGACGLQRKEARAAESSSSHAMLQDRCLAKYSESTLLSRAPSTSG